MLSSKGPSGAVRVFLVGVLLLAATFGVERSGDSAAQVELELCADSTCDQADVRVQVDGACSTNSNIQCVENAECPAAGGVSGRCLYDNQNFGFAIARGFLDGDGIADVVVGAPGKNRIYVFLGGVSRFAIRGSCATDPTQECDSDGACETGACVFEQPDLDPETGDGEGGQRDGAEIVLQGPANSQFGFAVAIDSSSTTEGEAGAGVFLNRVIVGAPTSQDPASSTSKPGGAFVIDADALADCSLEEGPCALEPSAGQLREGVTRIIGAVPNSRVGYAVAAGPDSFVVLGAPRVDAGRVYVVEVTGGGSSIRLDDPRADVGEITSTVANRGLGEALLLADLVTGRELAIGAVGTAAGTSNAPGRVYVVPWPGTDDVVLNDAAADGVGCLTTDSANDFFGFALAAGDFDASGVQELVVGAILGDRSTGFEGQNSGVIYAFDELDASFLNASGCATASSSGSVTSDTSATEYKRIPGARAWDQLGFSLVSGTFDGDAFDDLAVAARWHDREAVTTDVNSIDQGIVYVLPGGSTGPAGWPADLACLELDNCPSGSISHTLRGGDFDTRGGSDEIGFSMSAADLNDDGEFDDLLIGSITNERVYIVSLLDTDSDGLRDVADADDDGDGYQDLQEDCDLDGQLDEGETDPLVRNRDMGITLGIDLQGDAIVDESAVSCGAATDPLPPVFWVQIDLTNHSAVDAVVAPEPRLRVDLGDRLLFDYVPGSTQVQFIAAGGTSDPPINLADDVVVCTPPATPPCFDLRFLDTDTVAVLPPKPLAPGDRYRVRFQLRPKQDVGLVPTTEALTASIILEEGSAELPDQLCDSTGDDLELVIQPNTADRDVDLDCPDLSLEYFAEPVSCVPPHAPAAAVAGGCLLYHARVENGGRSVASQVQVIATLDPEINFPPIVPPAADGSICLCSDSSGGPCVEVTCALGDVGPAGGFAEASFLAQIDPTAAAGTTLENVARVTSADGELDGQNNAATGQGGAPNNDTVIAATADLEASNELCPPSGIPGASIDYRFRASNAGPSTAEGVELVVQLALGIEFESTNCGELPGVLTLLEGPSTIVTCTLVGALDPLSTKVLEVTGHVGPHLVANLQTTMAISSSTAESDPSDNLVTCSTTLSPSADLEITKSVDTMSATAGEPLVYTITVKNLGPSVAAGVVVTDTLPRPSGGGAVAVRDVEVVDCPRTDSVTAESASCEIGDLAPQETSPPFEIRVTTNSDLPPGPIENQATATSDTPDRDLTNNVGVAPTLIATAADLVVEAVSDGQTSVVAGTSPLTYAITVRNDGPSDAPAVTLTNALPRDTSSNLLVEVVDVTDDLGCAWSPGSDVVCTFPLAAISSQQIDVTVRVLSSVASNTTLRNGVTIAAVGGVPPDPDPRDNEREDADTVVAREVDLEILSFLDRLAPGELDPACAPDLAAGCGVEYEVQVANGGPSDAAQVGIRVDLPRDGSENQHEPPSTSNCSSPLGAEPALGGTASYDVGTGRFTCELPVLAAGQQRTLVMRSAITSDAANALPDGTLLTANASVVSTEAPMNPPVADTTTVVSRPVLTVIKSVTAAPVAGDPLTYVVTVTNQGPSDAVGTLISDTLPAELTFDEGLCPDGVLGQLGATVTCALGEPLPAGASYEFRLTAVVSRSVEDRDIITNEVTATAENAALATFEHGATVGVDSDVRVTIVPNQTDVIAGESIVFTIIVQNLGPSAVLNDPLDPDDFRVESSLPPEIVVTDETCPGIFELATATCELVGNLPAGELTFFTVTATVQPGAFGDLVYTAKVVWPPDAQEDTTSVAVPVCTAEICDGVDNDCNGLADFPGEQVDGDMDDAPSCIDCNDANPAVNPSAPEVCGNAIDDDCNGSVDDDGIGAVTWYADTDGDTYGDALNTLIACTQPVGYVANNTDCDDTIGAINPGATELTCDGTDQNCSGASDEAPDADVDLFDVCGLGDAVNPDGNDADCNDLNPAVNPGATEVCGNAIDDDCDGSVDEERAGTLTWYADTDVDTYGDPLNTLIACTQPVGYVSDNTDCDDTNGAINPGAVELTCDGADQNCNGASDESPDADVDLFDVCGLGDAVNPDGNPADCNDLNPAVNPGAAEVCGNAIDDDCDGSVDDDGTGAATWYADTDVDTYGDALNTLSACAQPVGYVSDNTDCDDTNGAINPGAAELTCDGADQNCNGASDEAPDADLDLFDVCGLSDAINPDGNAADCDDLNPDVNPSATEICGNAIDDDCDGSVDDDGIGAVTWYADTDVDTYGDALNTLSACAQPVGYVSDNTDCDDTNGAINPGAAELTCDGADQNCNGASDEAPDADLDLFDVCGPSDAINPDGNAADCDDLNPDVNPSATEICGNAIDDDCDGSVDDDGIGAVTWYADTDVDTYGDALNTLSACAQPVGYVSDNTDCDDTNGAINPGAAELTCDGADQNCNGASDEAPDADVDLFDVCGPSDAINPDGNAADCDDLNPDVNPSATEVCGNEIDDDCDGSVDDDGTGATTWYADTDVDTYGDALNTLSACAQPVGYVADSTDCDDTNGAINPGATELTCDGADQNCNGASDEAPDADVDLFDVCGPSDAINPDGNAADCDDLNPDVNPSATEVCGNEIDDDCDGSVDDDGTGAVTWYADTDVDTYGDALNTLSACAQPVGYVSDSTDCDDTNGAINPGATELTCDGADQNCNGASDEAPDADLDLFDVCGPSDAINPDGNAADCDDLNPDVNPSATEVCGNEIDDDCDGSVDDDGTGAVTWYADTDVDTYGDALNTLSACAQPVGYVSDSTDCDDTNGAINPGAAELTCDGADQNCNGASDEAPDADLDLFDVCGPKDAINPDGNAADCDDLNPDVNPSATEICGNAIDDDCDGSVDDDGTGAVTWYADTDVDTYGDALNTLSACAQPVGYVSDNTDCDDTNGAINPGATELTCDGVDQNCNGASDEAPDADLDLFDVCGPSDAVNPDGNAADCDDLNPDVNPGATEICGNAIDDDCDGSVDDDGTGAATWYADTDVDTYGDALNTLSACAQPVGYVSDNTDCDDTNGAINPGAAELTCDGTDQNCNASDEAPDADVDFFDVCGPSDAVNPDGNAADCDDTNGAINPGAAELTCDGTDQNCNASDEAPDTDVDLFDVCGPSDAVNPDGNPADCDDLNPAVHPGATEVCGNAIDEDCDGTPDSPGCSSTLTPSEERLRGTPWKPKRVRRDIDRTQGRGR